MTQYERPQGQIDREINERLENIQKLIDKRQALSDRVKAATDESKKGGSGNAK